MYDISMDRFFSQSLLILLSIAVIAPAQTKRPDAKALVERSVNAMGGVEKLKAIKSIHTHSVGHFYLLEQSERPEGPWLSVNQATEEWRDVEGGRIRRTYELSGVYTGKTTDIIEDAVSVTDGGG